jgi:RND family efflux transporter MFP subunit
MKSLRPFHRQKFNLKKGTDKMKNGFLVVAAIAILLIPLKVIFAGESVTALVQTQPLRQYDLTDRLSCYGTITVDPEKVISLNFPRAGQITRLLVRTGEMVKKGMVILEFETSPLDSVGYEQAQLSVDFARQELSRLKNLAADKLATRSQVAQAQKALSDAEASLKAQKQLGTDKKNELLVAPFDGLVTDLKVVQGERIQMGSTALQLARTDRLLAVLGVEPEDRLKIKVGIPVQVTSVFDGTIRESGMIRKVQGMVNPQTKLVDIMVDLNKQAAAALLPGMSVRGEIILNQVKGPAVPRQAVLKDDQGAYIFVVREGRAWRIRVKPGIESQGLVGITGPFRKNDQVVVLGNYELKDGMAVREGR